MDFDLRDSWSNYYKRTMNSTTIPGRESMESISIYFVYIDRFGNIRKVDREEEILINGDSILSQNRILQLMQNKRELGSDEKYEKDRYKLDEILTYFITLEPSQISSFINLHIGNTESFGFGLKSYLLPCDIEIPPSIFIFHPLNGIWFLFREMILVSPESGTKPLKSCLKKECSGSKTKKVRICLGVDHSPIHGKNGKNGKNGKTRKTL